jgi:hypothetical protein
VLPQQSEFREFDVTGAIDVEPAEYFQYPTHVFAVYYLVPDVRHHIVDLVLV